MQLLNEFAKLTTRYDMYKVLLRHGNVRRICEVGVDHGWNLTHLCKCRPEIAVAIDLWDVSEYYDFYTRQFHERNYREVIRRVLEENRCILPIRLDSIEAAQIFQDHYFQFIYVDAAHDYASAKRNIETYWPKVAENGFLAGHDYFSGEKTIPAKKLRLQQEEPVVLTFGVKDAVDEFAQAHNLKLAVIKDQETEIDSWVLGRP